VKRYKLSGTPAPASPAPAEEEIPFGVWAEIGATPPQPSASAEAQAPSRETESRANAREIVRLFAGEDCEDFIEKEAIADLVAYAASMKKTLEDVQEKYECAKEEIRRRLLPEMGTQKKLVQDYGDNQVVLSRRAGSVKFDAEAYITGELGENAWKELEATKKMVQDGTHTSPFFQRGKESLSVEVI
jgi:hypothetical protein